MPDQERSIPVGVLRCVRCPGCQRVYSAPVGTRWYWREVRRLLGYPELLCVDCCRAAELAAKTGQAAAAFRNPEKGAV